MNHTSEDPDWISSAAWAVSQEKHREQQVFEKSDGQPSMLKTKNPTIFWCIKLNPTDFFFLTKRVKQK